ncbi:alpha/beta hydrolase [Longispora sp. NPDC051575]|uniref:alpha/beta fold hydrolase n=1 Tax=Longispora sp. NPDC051575 TaxID=3154943 RepID=UPI003421423A
MPTVALPDVTLHYTEVGDPTAPPVVLLHGTPANSTRWTDIAAALADGYRVIAVDQRGHGRSGHTPTYSFESYRRDVLDFADALGLDRFALVGHSMGGTVACLFAEHHSDRLTALVLVDSPPPREPGDWDPGPRPTGDLDYDWNVLPAIFAQLNKPDPAWWAELPRIAVPTLLVSGGSTSPVPPEWNVDLVSLVPGARLVTIEGAGHQVHTNRPTEFLAAVRPFLDSTAR